MARLSSGTALAASAARTVTGQSDWFFIPSIEMRVQLDVTAASGTTPTLNVVIEDTLDGVNANTIGTFVQKTAAGREVINITALSAAQVRVKWTIGGTTPSFTFAVLAAHDTE